MKSLACFFALLCAALSILSSCAGSGQGSSATLTSHELTPLIQGSPFDKGRYDFSVVGQNYWSFAYGSNRPTVNYWLGAARLGYMLNSPHGKEPWLKNRQLIFEGLYSEVTHGPGNWIAGGNVIHRWNRINRNGQWVWYAQFGGGLVGNDIYKDQTQLLVGRSVEISGVAGIGLRYLLNDRWSIGLEANYRHISNAGTADRNQGLDSLGGGVFVTHSF